MGDSPESIPSRLSRGEAADVVILDLGLQKFNDACRSSVLRYTKEALRAVRFMNEPQASDYLNAKSDALKHQDSPRSVASRSRGCGSNSATYGSAPV